MRRNRKDNAKKERIIMIASSAFVLTALTMTGVYMQSRDQESENDGYTIDFSALENNVDDKRQEIVENNLGDSIFVEDDRLVGDLGDYSINMEDDLDYMPMEAGSNLVEIPGLTDDKEEPEEEQKEAPSSEKPAAQVKEPVANENSVINEEPTIHEDPVIHEDPIVYEDSVESPTGISYTEMPPSDGGQNTMGDNVVVTQDLHFVESDGLRIPLEGEYETIIPFSQEIGVYFRTLDHYKRSNAMVLSAAEGAAVTACAEGRVVDIFENEEIGHAITMELGDGYQITYGQLRDIQVGLGSYVNAGDVFAVVAAPTKYYVREGANLYLKLTSNGTAIDPSPLLH